jgi:two-component system, cell cycle sensor histidine kinase and response regulator CckA
VVEDDEAVRAVAVSWLQRSGYRVLEAGDAKEALRVARAHEGGIGLLLTDVILPGMGGAALADTLRAERPDLRVLYFSGYTREAAVHNGLLGGGAAFLHKPFALPELARSVRLVLDTPIPPSSAS